jgi:hypothetical protein
LNYFCKANKFLLDVVPSRQEKAYHEFDKLTFSGGLFEFIGAETRIGDTSVAGEKCLWHFARPEARRG